MVAGAAGTAPSAAPEENRIGYEEIGDEEVGDEEEEVLEGRWDEEEAVERRRAVEGYGAVNRGGSRLEPAHHDPWGDVERV